MRAPFLRTATWLSAVYPNELGANAYRLGRTGKADTEEIKKLACFDLRSGKILWQSWVNAEALSSSVISGTNVYLTCLSGKLYEFDRTTGSPLGSINDVALSPPTVVNDKVFVSVKNGSNETVSVHSINGLKPVKKISTLSSPMIVDDFYQLSASASK